MLFREAALVKVGSVVVVVGVVGLTVVDSVVWSGSTVKVGVVVHSVEVVRWVGRTVAFLMQMLCSQ